MHRNLEIPLNVALLKTIGSALLMTELIHIQQFKFCLFLMQQQIQYRKNLELRFVLIAFSKEL